MTPDPNAIVADPRLSPEPPVVRVAVVETKGRVRKTADRPPRVWWRLAVGLVGVSATAAAGVVVWRAAAQSPAARAEWYAAQAKVAAAAGRTPEERRAAAAAAVPLSAAAVRHSPSRERTYDLAMICLRAQDVSRAVGLLQAVAPVDRLDYPPAHLQLVRLMLAGVTRTAAAAEAVEKHLRLLAVSPGAGEPERGEAAVLLAELCLSTGRAGEAVNLLADVKKGTPARVLLAAALAAAGNRDRAAVEARLSAVGFAERVQANADDVAARLLLSRCRVLEGEHAAAIRLLNDGLRRDDKNSRLRAARADAYLAWLADVEADRAAAPGRRFDVLQEALAAHPNDPRLLILLSGFSDPNRPEAAKVKAVLTAQLTDARNAELAHMVLGGMAWQEGDGRSAEAARHLAVAALGGRFGPHRTAHLPLAAVALRDARQKSAAAITHLEQAALGGRVGPLALNNLAWVLAYADPPQLDRAKGLVDSAVRAAPDVPQFRHTRGEVLYKQGKWAEAVADFEAALPKLAPPTAAATHGRLADAYAQLGQRDLAAAHRAKATPKKP